jgi:hypothetical protein
MLIYKPTTTIRDLNTSHTAVQGEDCIVEAIEINGKHSYAVVLNSQNNKLNIPLDILDKYFTIFEVKC